MFKILNAINKACYEYNYRHTFPFTDERDNVIKKYVKRKDILNRLEEKLIKYLKRG